MLIRVHICLDNTLNDTCLRFIPCKSRGIIKSSTKPQEVVIE